MKQVLAIAAAFAVLFILTMTLGVAQANPPAAYAPQATDTVTPTATPTEPATATPTATATATTDPCTVNPAKPNLVAPKRNATLASNTVTFKWKNLDCIKRYRVDVRRGSPNGPKVWSRGTKNNQIAASGLVRGYTYFWKVRACTTLGLCTWSKVWSFTLPKSAPPPTKTPTPGATTSATPVPSGDPPPQIAVYKGDGVYLNSDPNALYRFSCGPDGWAQFRQSLTMYHIGLWFTPNERINFSRLDFNLGTVVQTGTLYANSSGYVSYNVDTSSWTPAHHYHMIFDGATSGIQRCGHFDVIPNTAPESKTIHAPHTQAEWQLLEERMHAHP
ncbi:MAG: hypothetical protein HY741_08230 [Chloroflexi bacterium]|nr:hypothetical protein [Chloroflexota bacterium]